MIENELYNSLQGFYADTPHIEVFVLEADKILRFINSNLPNITK